MPSGSSPRMAATASCWCGRAVNRPGCPTSEAQAASNAAQTASANRMAERYHSRVIDTRNLFAPLHAELMSLLRGLKPDDWEKPTIARAWRVRDVAAHLLDTQLRKLSGRRDGHRLAPDRPLIDYINHLNATWVDAARRLSPRVIVDLVDVTGRTVAALMESLALHERAE